MADFSEKYNTKLSKEEEAEFQAWLAGSGRAGDVADYDLRGWFKKSGKTDERGHMSDEFKKPNHPTFSEDSLYHGTDEYEGGKWVGSEKKGWTFKPSKSNLANMPVEDLKAYFDRVEPGVKLELPETDAPAKTAPRLYDHPTSATEFGYVE